MIVGMNEYLSWPEKYQFLFDAVRDINLGWWQRGVDSDLEDSVIQAKHAVVAWIREDLKEGSA